MSEPITLEEAKAHLRVTYADEDQRISALISAARNHCENEMGVLIGVATVTAGGQEYDIPDVVNAAILLTLECLYRGDETTMQKSLDAAGFLLRLSPLYQRLGAA